MSIGGCWAVAMSIPWDALFSNCAASPEWIVTSVGLNGPITICIAAHGQAPALLNRGWGPPNLPPWLTRRVECEVLTESTRGKLPVEM